MSSVYITAGDLEWSQQPTPGNELRSLAIYDLDGNGDLEILVASTRSDNQWFVYNHNGTLYPGSLAAARFQFTWLRGRML